MFSFIALHCLHCNTCKRHTDKMNVSLALLSVAYPYLSQTTPPLSLLSRRARQLFIQLTKFPLTKSNHQRITIPCRILTVGDGNLSFSLSLCNHFRSILLHPSMLQFVATTFDNLTAIQTKYPESKQIINKLTNKNVIVKHQINAVSLPATLGTYSMIVFNHPHLGIEDAASHRILLAHFFHSCRRRLRSNGTIYVSLIEGQPERWKLIEEASRNGYACVETIPMETSNFPEYEIKRTHSGRSFVSEHSKKQSNYSQSSTFYCFVSKKNKHMYSNQTNQKKRKRRDTTQSSHTSKEGTNKATKTNNSNSNNNGNNNSNSNNNTISSVPIHRCEECSRNFSTVQGLKTHRHQVHVLNLYVGAKKAKCIICMRDFTSETSLEQHMLAKHGADQSIQPHSKQYTSVITASSNSSSSTSDTNLLKCSICRNTFLNQIELDSHLTLLEPIVIKPSHICSTCQRIFGDERALRQHQNFCTQNAKKDTYKKGVK